MQHLFESGTYSRKALNGVRMVHTYSSVLCNVVVQGGWGNFLVYFIEKYLVLLIEYNDLIVKMMQNIRRIFIIDNTYIGKYMCKYNFSSK